MTTFSFLIIHVPYSSVNVLCIIYIFSSFKQPFIKKLVTVTEMLTNHKKHYMSMGNSAWQDSECRYSSPSAVRASWLSQQGALAGGKGSPRQHGLASSMESPSKLVMDHPLKERPSYTEDSPGEKNLEGLEGGATGTTSSAGGTSASSGGTGGIYRAVLSASNSLEFSCSAGSCCNPLLEHCVHAIQQQK